MGEKDMRSAYLLGYKLELLSKGDAWANQSLMKKNNRLVRAIKEPLLFSLCKNLHHAKVNLFIFEKFDDFSQLN